MKSTWARLKNFTYKGKTRVPWAERCINDYSSSLVEEFPDHARQLEKTPYAKFNGSPHATETTNDPWHASVTLRKKDDFKGSGLSLHVYPDGTVRPSKAEFPVIKVTPATKEELGEHDARWLDPEFERAWQESNKANDGFDTAGSSKGKGKAKAQSSSGSSSKQHKSSQKNRDAPSSSKQERYLPQYTSDPDTGEWYRYTEDGSVVYWDPDSQHEYYYDDQGQVIWL
ncbi:hypothetical protein CONLIGDRAFT_611478 [Coniochaeta ligniaria NRRL 30616]|uniref:Uncharacterized protein n=1 Tax=Coniochaeta ligniaria NRRL 30616 TaxID=1408157 RepID=A0A1J7J4B7_9PEZI|nr:hypothetical protein CONLIGDRAFT_611478 [Coniochaeta ligniaria NRRL 30616]